MLGDGCKVLLADDSAGTFEAEAQKVVSPSNEGKVKSKRPWARVGILLMVRKKMATPTVRRLKLQKHMSLAATRFDRVTSGL